MQLKKSSFVTATLAFVAAAALVTAHAGIWGKPGTKIIYKKWQNGPVVGTQEWKCNGSFVTTGKMSPYPTYIDYGCGE